MLLLMWIHQMAAVKRGGVLSVVEAQKNDSSIEIACSRMCCSSSLMSRLFGAIFVFAYLVIKAEYQN